MSSAGEPPRTSVGELLSRARCGDDDCRQRLFALGRNYIGLVARAELESWLHAKVDASDIVQQTLLEAHRDFDRFEGQSQGQWLGWLRRILTHNLRDCVRAYRNAKRQAGREVPLAPASTAHFRFEPAAADPSPSQQVVQLDDELQLTEAVARLPADYQEVIVLRNLERLPFDAVAARMGRSRGAVQMLWMRAIRQLHELLTE